MNMKKVLALAAVVLMAVPAYAAASQIVVPGVTEQVVEGHTVFAVIEKAVMNETVIEAAAVAVLVRERVQIRENFKGVLWFNDQFLVAPYEAQRNNLRHPCGGAVLAVNSGSPDPRTLLVTKDDNEALPKLDRLTTLSGEQHDVIQIYQDSAADPYDLQDMAAGGSWADADFDTTTISSTAATGALNYVESYLITDPNDHTWIVDKYLGVTTVSAQIDPITPGVTPSIVSSTFPIWAVNILGSPVFIPDTGNVNCSPFVDDPFQQSRINSAFITADETICGATLNPPTGPVLPDACPSAAPGLGQDPNGDTLPIDGWDAKPPAIGYYEPTDPADSVNSYCYDGNIASGSNTGRAPGSGCRHGAYPGTADPVTGANSNTLRRYNAVLYFYLGPNDVVVTTPNLAHAASDTNGCEQSATYADGSPKPATEWLCPGGDDNAEGNSHPFNPPGVYVPTVFDPTTGTQIPGTGQYIDIWDANRACSLGYNDATPQPDDCMPLEHATHNRGLVDLYFSTTARPMEPGVRFFETLDYYGSTDYFHENSDGTLPTPAHP